MRVLFAIAHLDKGGGQAVQAAQLFERLAPRVDGTLLCLRAASETGVPVDAGRVEVVGRLRFPGGLRELEHAIRARAGEYDLLQAFDQYYALPAAKLARARPIVVRLGAHPTQDLASRYGMAGRAFLGLANPWLFSGTQVVVNAHHLLDTLPGRCPVLIPNGVEVGRFPAVPRRDAARLELDLPRDVPLAGFTGKIIPRKNVEELYGLLREVPDLHLLLVGGDREPYYGDQYHRGLRRAFEDVLARVHHVGEVRPDRVPRYLEAMDLFVFPSRLEGMPNSVLEAMASALPIVARETPAHREILAPDAGRLYGSPAELAEAVRALRADPASAAEMGANARRVVQARFSFEAAVEAYLRLYEEVLEGNRPPVRRAPPR
ncbi:MAG TPA: glycosyltransferase family 4 protein [Thermoplasmata archaeon]|nr:glycosyltransferase family 4 protein [Thermoplasmata archaeon]